MTGPRSSLSKCTSSMTSKPTDWTIPSEPLRVVTSHFSGVVTITSARLTVRSSLASSVESPVSSQTLSGASLAFQSRKRSCVRALSGAM